MKLLRKNSILIIAGLVLIFSGCKKAGEDEDLLGTTTCQDAKSLNFGTEGNCVFAENVQKSIFVKFTGTWCWACGDYGADIVHQMEAKYHDNVMIFEAHKSAGEPMNNPIVDAWQAYWAHSSTPSFVANSTLLTGHPIAPGSAEIDKTNGTIPTAGVAASYSIANNVISGTAYLKAFSALTGKYNLAVYVVGDGFVDKQIADDGSKNPASFNFDASTKTYLKYVHTNILRGEVNNSAFGKNVVTASLAKDKVIKLAFSIPKDVKWTEDLRVVVVAWIDNGGGKYTFVNTAEGTLK